MINFEKEELLKIAKLSGFTLDDDEIETFRERLAAVIEYANELDSVEVKTIIEPKINVSVYREDKAIKSDTAKTLLEQSPEKHDEYFVVPKIL